MHRSVIALCACLCTTHVSAEITSFKRTAPGSAAPAASGIADPPPAMREFRAAWIPTVGNMDWPSAPGLNSIQQQRELLSMLDKAAELKFNAVVFQVRPCCDALYASQLEPWSEFLTGQQGKSPGWDPLEFLIKEGHKRCIEVHAWLNPYRAGNPSEKGAKAPTHLSSLRPDLVKKYGTHLWLDPGEPEVSQHSLNVVTDIVRRYDVDGIHFDDYFYPYRERDGGGKMLDFPDEPSWKKYQAGGGKLPRDDWRRDNINQFVRRCYETIKQTRPHVLFGISPFGSWRPNNPPGAKTMDAYAELYADSKKWWHSGWVDYMTPQIYWPMKNPDHGFPRMLTWWSEENRARRHLWPGLITSQIGQSDKKGFTPQVIVEEIETTRRTPGATGTVHFRMSGFMKNVGGINDLLAQGVFLEHAVAPASTWLDTQPPAAPQVSLGTSGARSVTWAPGDNSLLRQWCIYRRVAGKWSLAPIPPDQLTAPVQAAGSAAPDAIAISAVDRFGHESARAVLQTK